MNKPLSRKSVVDSSSKISVSTRLWENRYQGIFLKMLSYTQIGELIVKLPNGESRRFKGKTVSHFNELQNTKVELHINDTRFFKAMISKGGIGLAESYRDGWCDSPNMLHVLLFAIENQEKIRLLFEGKWYGKLLHQLTHWRRKNTKVNSQKNIHAHYDIGNDFYQLWLDPSMTYSSALYAEDEGLSLEQAQNNKYAEIFAQTELKAGDSVLEIGCGWGGFAEYAAKQGVNVVAISLSKEQLNYAKQRISKLGLSEMCEFRFQDYRDLPDDQFDAIVSIEMIEAVGKHYWDSYFKTLHDKLKNDGKVVVQAILYAGENFERYINSTDFIQYYIFPGGILPSAITINAQLKNNNMNMLNNLRFGRDYAKTLTIWQKKFDASLNQIKAQGFDEAFIKLWRFYFFYCQAGFISGKTTVCHFTAKKID